MSNDLARSSFASLVHALRFVYRQTSRLVDHRFFVRSRRCYVWIHFTGDGERLGLFLCPCFHRGPTRPPAVLLRAPLKRKLAVLATKNEKGMGRGMVRDGHETRAREFDRRTSSSANTAAAVHHMRESDERSTMARTKRKGGWRSGVGSWLSPNPTYLRIYGLCSYSALKPKPMMGSPLNAGHDSSLIPQVCWSPPHFSFCDA